MTRLAGITLAAIAAIHFAGMLAGGVHHTRACSANVEACLSKLP